MADGENQIDASNIFKPSHQLTVAGPNFSETQGTTKAATASASEQYLGTERQRLTLGRCVWASKPRGETDKAEARGNTNARRRRYATPVVTI